MLTGNEQNITLSAHGLSGPVLDLGARAGWSTAQVPGGTMSDWLINLPVLWMGALILGAIYVCTAGLYLLITALAVGERARAFKGISPGILPPLAVIFALLVGFLAAQVWNDQDAITQEWPAMARRNATLAIAPARLAEALALALTLTPRSEGQIAAQREMVASLQNALEARRQATATIAPRTASSWQFSPLGSGPRSC